MILTLTAKSGISNSGNFVLETLKQGAVMRMSLRISLVIGAVAACMMSQLSFADTATSANNSSTAVAKPRLSDHFTADYLGLFTGGALSDPGASYSPGPDGKPNPATPQQVENYVSGYYKISDTVKVGPRAHFYYSPVQGKNITMLDPLLQITDTNLYSRGNFKLSGYARAYLPVTAESTATGRQIQFRFLLNPNYEIPHTRFTVGVYSYAQPASYSGYNATNTTFATYLAPYVYYQLTRTVSITSLYEMAAVRMQRQGDLTSFNNGGTDFEPGVNWDISPNFSINPYLNFYTGNQISMDSTSINMLIVGKFF